MLWIDGQPTKISFMGLANAQGRAREGLGAMRYNRGQRRRLERDFVREGRRFAVQFARDYPRQPAPPPTARTTRPGRTRRKRIIARLRAEAEA